MTQWFASDHHFWHENIISFCDRPFSNAEEMNERLIEWHNEFVKPSDHVTFLGDVTMRRGSAGGTDAQNLITLIKRMNGHKRLILGNHDHFPPKVYIEAGFEKIYGAHRIGSLMFTHIPVHPSSLSSVKANVHGHIHNNQDGAFPPVMKIDKVSQVVRWVPYVNISLEVTNYHPVTLEWIEKQVEGEEPSST